MRVLDSGDTAFLEGEHVDKQNFRDANERAKKKKDTPAMSEPLLLGITKASLTTQSFISAASFQETTRVLTDAAIRGARDELMGLKENIIIGHLIPAGTGMYRYQEVDIEGAPLPPEPEILPEPSIAEILAEPDLEEELLPKAGALPKGFGDDEESSRCCTKKGGRAKALPPFCFELNHGTPY